MRAWQVRDVMTVEVAAVAPEASYREVVNMITGHRVGGVPVIDDAGRVLGVVSEVDVLHKLEMAETPERRRLFTGRRRAKAKAEVARDLMTAPAVTATPYDSVVSAAKRMDRERVKRLPVVDDGGHLVGIVTRGDLLKVHLRPDADIRRDVVDKVLRGRPRRRGGDRPGVGRRRRRPARRSTRPAHGGGARRAPDRARRRRRPGRQPPRLRLRRHVPRRPRTRVGLPHGAVEQPLERLVGPCDDALRCRRAATDAARRQGTRSPASSTASGCLARACVCGVSGSSHSCAVAGAASR